MKKSEVIKDKIDEIVKLYFDHYTVNEAYKIVCDKLTLNDVATKENK